MNTRDRHRLERHARRIEELRLWRNAREWNVEAWDFAAGNGEARRLGLGDFWPEIETPVWLTSEAVVPEEWAGLPVELELWLGGEGFVRLSTGTVGGLNPFHRSYVVAREAEGGEKVGIEAEVVSKGMFGSHVAEPRLTRAALVVPEVEVRALERDLSLVAEACDRLGEHDAVPHLLDALDEAFASLAPYWPSESDTIVSRYLRGYENPIGNGLYSLPSFAADKALDVNRLGRELWSMPETSPPEPLPQAARSAVEKARRLVASRLEGIKEEYPPVGNLALTGHAHIDLAWLWPLAETRRKGRRTFASVLGLMDRYEDFTYNQSSAQLYAWIEEDDPALFEQVRERVAEGRWEAVGGMWCEPDCQVTGGESFVRQLLHGQQYFEDRFGRRSTVAWLPDVFGFSPGIPQLLLGAGISGFFTAKLKWSETNRFPHDLFSWEGIDGSRVTAHTILNPGADYNGDIVPFDLLGVWENFGGKRVHQESLFAFGWGDGGGGPSEKMLENYTRLKDFPALPRLRMARVDEHFKRLPGAIPRWVGELYLEFHRGTLTSQGKTKKLNREAEHRLLEAEAFAATAALHGAEYPGRKLDRLWKILLLNQFHDILPGSSISEVYEDAHRELGEVVDAAKGLRDDALGNLAAGTGADDAVLVANAGLAPRGLSVLLADGILDGAKGVTDAGGDPVPSQLTGEGLLVHDPGRTVPALGWTTLRPDHEGRVREVSSGVRAELSGETVVLENSSLRVEIGADGTLHRVYDREMAREVLDGRGNQVWAYVDKPREWDAWDIDEDYELEGEELGAVEGVEVIEDGPLRASVRVERRWRSSRVVQTYRLHEGSRRLDVETEISWHERQVLLRALFPLRIRSHEATFETMYGAHRRPTHRNTSWDSTRFEVSAHRYADLSEPGYGVALLNDGKYGHSARDNVLGLSLLKSPMYPDPLADEGDHRFTYSVFPHAGDWTEARVVEEAFALNSPLFAAQGQPSGELPTEFGLVSTEGLQVALGSLKMAEDGRGLVLRVYEPRGARGECALRFARGVGRAERANLLEDEQGSVEVRDGAVRLELRPFEVVTLRVELHKG
ncbi:MAG: glycosyl hydrolase-related protein [Actinomycetota bacterium]|nr:glycosyl hydrolase-related protein [Actinomycetota bacterium]